MQRFNSLKSAKTIEEAGVPRAQAEAHIEIISELISMNLATKDDVHFLRTDAKSEMVELRADFSELRTEFLQLEQRWGQNLLLLEQRMTIKLGTIVSIAIGVAVALTKLIN